jgi:hypothetical protein
MRSKELYYIITFGKTTQALAMEKLCEREGIPGRLIPLPVKISASCGLAWRMRESDYLAQRDRLEQLNIECEQTVTLMM